MFGTYQRLGVHVATSNRAVVKAASRKLKRSARRSRAQRVARRAFYRQMLEHHAAARALYYRVSAGTGGA